MSADQGMRSGLSRWSMPEKENAIANDVRSATTYKEVRKSIASNPDMNLNPQKVGSESAPPRGRLQPSR